MKSLRVNLVKLNCKSWLQYWSHTAGDLVQSRIVQLVKKWTGYGMGDRSLISSSGKYFIFATTLGSIWALIQEVPRIKWPECEDDHRYTIYCQRTISGSGGTFVFATKSTAASASYPVGPKDELRVLFFINPSMCWEGTVKYVTAGPQSFKIRHLWWISQLCI